MPGLPKSKDGCKDQMRNASFKNVLLCNMTQKIHSTNTH